MKRVYNNDLALYPPKSPRKPASECLPPVLEPGQAYPFEKPGHRNYLPDIPVTLMEIKKEDVLFHMKAQVQVVSSRFEMRDGKAYTAGTYVVRELLKDE